MPSTKSDFAAIEATDLRKSYGSEVALDGVSLSISNGTVYGFLGPNGAGKTTTMRLLTGLTQPSSGSARICSLDVENRRELAANVGYLPETPPLYDEFSAREQLEYAADLRDIPAETADARITDYLDQFGLTGDENKRISTYSKGMQQKTAFIQSILHDPKVLFLDEPTSGLDPRAARRIRESITGFADAGSTVFLSTHILPVVEAVADEVGVLFDGRLVAEGSPNEVKSRAETGSESTLEDAFLAITSDETPMASASRE
ncbi:ABC transporter ATP-binding protein (plasmid) [Haloferax mediterranei ATCC 33500]|uniref:ABC transporter ATP-binding protein n=1 Tax=Haloferax mediterranei (strain ATCC 33500 / DSM 1411 / JCM 8866 / NBRC 14739 / NCIMB 2177 / R-4) TaxID=523841 RepID=I3R9S3_HALMT|nr:ABC transporter ATP-binding protein [Haloferax mediterranei]AFK20983.1 ABC-type transport system ATP-binding protein [Haloferax mediterranei ATCC 33500]AHZ24153.1 daunorubicin ABC transporter ATPase [Haloferax mediterranei ATCC 33500]EMA05230.1 ABC-type transport system ATP-binding protein [Haloferax mediterranei ATCC 33500]MDX5989966.1 ABC transporter ATP-binding protein [Haloferax mediterranei ATCC 33500]QCQ77153.1 ABC transporter ATP-binding protein [Haloferax mediterranei ATCC 33500]